MKAGIVALLGFVLVSSPVQAAGVSKSVVATINETTLQGYTPSSPPGLTQFIQYFVASTASDPNQKIAAIVGENGGTATSLPKQLGLTLLQITPAAAIITKENLPALAQLTAADCNISPPTNTCPSTFFVSANPDKSIPGRLIVSVFRQSFSPFTQSSVKTVSYAFDPAATTAADRWSLIEYSTGNTFAGVTLSTTLPERNLYSFIRTAPTTMSVVRIVNK